MPFQLVRAGAPLALALTLATPAMTQDFDPSQGAEAVAVLEDGRLLIRNGETAFDCALTAGDAGPALEDCQPRTGAGDAMAAIEAMTEEDWQALVRETLVASECKLSAFSGLGTVIEAAATARGSTPAEIESLRAAMTERAEAAVDAMLKRGDLSVRDGELVLYGCP